MKLRKDVFIYYYQLNIYEKILFHLFNGYTRKIYSYGAKYIFNWMNNNCDTTHKLDLKGG